MNAALPKTLPPFGENYGSYLFPIKSIYLHGMHLEKAYDVCRIYKGGICVWIVNVFLWSQVRRHSTHFSLLSSHPQYLGEIYAMHGGSAVVVAFQDLAALVKNHKEPKSFVRYFTITWSLWSRRNKRLFENFKIPPGLAVDRALANQIFFLLLFHNTS